MKRLGSSDSLGGLMSICPSSAEENSPSNNHVYNRDQFQSMLDGLDEEGCLEESGHVPEKKRRLSVDQVKALEKNFEVENKLDPERKVKLAQDLGLQPRQVAVWFQNRRARWKTKQLERDYGLMKANYDSLKLNFEALQQDNEALLKEIRELKSKLNEDNAESNNLSVKEEAMISESDHRPPPLTTISTPPRAGSEQPFKSAQLTVVDFKDGGASDSDSSAILNEENSPNAAAANSQSFAPLRHILLLASFSPTSSSAFRFNCSSSSSPSPSSITTYFNLSESSTGDVLGGSGAHKGSSSSYEENQPPFVKMEEEHDFFSEEACNFYAEDQAPTLHHLYCADQWT